MAGVAGRSGRKFDTVLRDALLPILKLDEDDSRKGKTKADKVVIALVNKAIEGDVPAIREIWDRVEGKVPQALEHGGPDGEALSLPAFNVYLHPPEK